VCVRYDRLCGLVVRVSSYRARGPGFDSRRYQIFWEVVGLQRGPLSLVNTIEALLGSNSSSSGLENRDYGRGVPLRWPRDTLYPKKLALTSPTSGSRSVRIIRLRAKTTEFVVYVYDTVQSLCLLHSKGFWRWCVTLRTTVFFDFVYRPVF
jgi:hypothetical protein